MSTSSIILPPSLMLPFSQEDIKKAIEVNDGKTPFHLYSGRVILETTRRLNTAFQNQGFDFKNHYAVKALPNPHILQILAGEGMGMDCSSIPEIHLAQMVGVSGEGIMFTSNNTSIQDFAIAKEAGAIINLDGFSHIAKLRSIGLPDIVCCRYNPGKAKEGNSIIGESEKQKFGMRKDQIIEAYRLLKEKGVQRFGLHAMMVSNERRETALIENARLLFELAGEIYAETGVTFEFINLGGGIGVPYRPDALPDDTYTNHEVDLDIFARGVRVEYDKIFGENLGKPKIFMENGRYVTGPAGVLITRVRNIDEKYATFVGVDANMSSLMRPGMYGAYHHISVIGKEYLPHDHAYHVTGDLCENNDQFTAGTLRMLPEIEEGDTIAIHTDGAHASAMTFNYNGKLRSPEFLQALDGSIKIIKKGETEEDLFRNIVPM